MSRPPKPRAETLAALAKGVNTVKSLVDYLGKGEECVKDRLRQLRYHGFAIHAANGAYRLTLEGWREHDFLSTNPIVAKKQRRKVVRLMVSTSDFQRVRPALPAQHPVVACWL